MHDLGIHNHHYMGSTIVYKNGVEHREHFFSDSILADEKELEKSVLDRFPNAKIVSTSFSSKNHVVGITTVRKERK